MSNAHFQRLLRMLVVGGALSGCAHGAGSVDDLRAKLNDTQRKEADERKRIEDLENRVFLLSDQLETQKLTAQPVRAPRLPVVTLRPTRESEEAVEPRADERDDDQGDAIDEAAEPQTRVSRAGDPPRRVLRGVGPAQPPIDAPPPTYAVEDKPPPKKRARPPMDDVRTVSMSSGDSLGVAPVPPIPKTPAPSGSSTALDHGPMDAEPLTQYRAAYALVTAGKYEDAVVSLRAFLKRFPRHDYADNAQYWIGECFYARHLYREAAVEFRATVDKYGTGNKAPDAMLKLAYSLVALNEPSEARRLLESFPSSYPRTEASRLAAVKLAELAPSASRTEDRR